MPGIVASVYLFLSVGCGTTRTESFYFSGHALNVQITLRGRDMILPSWRTRCVELDVVIYDTGAITSPYSKILHPVLEQSLG